MFNLISSNRHIVGRLRTSKYLLLILLRPALCLFSQSNVSFVQVLIRYTKAGKVYASYDTLCSRHKGHWNEKGINDTILEIVPLSNLILY